MSSYYDDEDSSDAEGDCPDCDGEGEVCCSACGGYGCSQCLDGHRMCWGCGGTGFRPIEPDGNEDI